MAEEMKKYLHKIMSQIGGIHAVLITDRDGVPVLKAATENAPELAMRPSFLTTVGMATDQAGKLGMGKSQRIACIYGKYQVIHFNRFPLMVSMIASSSANTGMILGLESELSSLIQDLKAAVDVI
ncbi:late endosomal/lysosomal adaptor, MAPK and MTOR activator 3 isoform X1 [Tachypleus tridentatus]|uniref:late endosomal/lysosomal adaptor, MAPK and MTOR activator 3 isoform X1 n=2 Tax=Tachypleus tridentatus TaxID=6853 RepID=UPI003FD593CA